MTQHLSIDDYKNMATAYYNAYDMMDSDFAEVPMPGELHSYYYEGPVKAKERARKSRSGAMFTPPATRAFEKSVAEWGKKHFKEPIGYPIRVGIAVHEHSELPSVVMHSLFGLVYNDKGDVDNFAKSILDGLNKIAFKDDKLIVDLRVRRRYATKPGFRISFERKGLTKFEYLQFTKVLNRVGV